MSTNVHNEVLHFFPFLYPKPSYSIAVPYAKDNSSCIVMQQFRSCGFPNSAAHGWGEGRLVRRREEQWRQSSSSAIGSSTGSNAWACAGCAGGSSEACDSNSTSYTKNTVSSERDARPLVITRSSIKSTWRSNSADSYLQLPKTQIIPYSSFCHKRPHSES